MKRNKKSVVKAFESAFTESLKKAGIEPIGNLSWHEETPEYRIETSVGPYTFHYSPQIGDKGKGVKPLNFIGVYGRFEDPARAKTRHDCNQFNGKWNHDGVGHVATEKRAIGIAQMIAHKILTA